MNTYISEPTDIIGTALPSYMLSDALSRTVESWGLTGAEIDRIRGAVLYMGKRRKRIGKLYYAVVGDDLFDEPQDRAREIIEQVRKRLTAEQRRDGIPPYWLTVLETECGLHANLIFPGNGRIATVLGTAFLKYLGQLPERRDDLPDLIDYVSKEAISKASHKVRYRRRGSHRLEGGGDRVRLSEALRLDAIAAGDVQPWQRTNARRSEIRKKHKPRPLIRRTVQEAGQGDLFSTNSPARIRDHAGGYLSSVARIELDFIRRSRGLTWNALAAQSGISRPTLINAWQGRYALSPWAMNRVREVIYGQAC